MLTPEKLAKLPRWAQSHIKLLTMQKNELQTTIDQLYAPDENAQVTWYQSWGRKDMSLPPHAMVKFALNSDPAADVNWDQQIAVRIDKREKFYSDKSKKEHYWLEIRGHSEITVHPQAANVIHVRVTGGHS